MNLVAFDAHSGFEAHSGLSGAFRSIVRIKRTVIHHKL